MQNSVPRETANLRAFSVKEVCQRLSIGRTLLYKHIKSGKIPARKIRSRTVFLPDELEAALKSLPLAGGAS